MGERKVEEAQFWECLYKNCGNFAATAESISAVIGQPYTRQAVEKRAKRQPERLEHIKSRFVDVAEHTLLWGMTQRENIPAAISAAKFVAQTKGKDRGYDTTSNLNIKTTPTIGDLLDMADEDFPEEVIDADETDYSGEREEAPEDTCCDTE